MKFIILVTFFLISFNSHAIYEGKNYKNRYQFQVLPFYDNLNSLLYSTFDGSNLFAKFLDNKSEKLLIILPGYTQPTVEFAEVAYDLKSLGYDILIHDLRSQGGSDRPLPERNKVHLINFKSYLLDMDALYNKFVKDKNYKEVVLLGHSLGGAIALAHAQEHPEYYQKLILSVPMMEINFGISSSIVNLAINTLSFLGMSESFAPGVTSRSGNDFENNRVTNSLNRYEMKYENRKKYPNHFVKGATNSWVKQAILLSDYVYSNRNKTGEIETLMLLAGKDKLSHSERQQQFCKEMKNCELVMYQDAKHEIFNEIDKIRSHALNKIDNFLKNGLNKINMDSINK